MTGALDRALAEFEKLPLEDQQAWLVRFKQAMQAGISARKQELRAKIAELEELEKNGAPKKSPIKPKYRDPETGKTWSGRGEMAAWLREKKEAGEDIEVYRVQG